MCDKCVGLGLDHAKGFESGGDWTPRDRPALLIELSAELGRVMRNRIVALTIAANLKRYQSTNG